MCSHLNESEGVSKLQGFRRGVRDPSDVAGLEVSTPGSRGWGVRTGREFKVRTTYHSVGFDFSVPCAIQGVLFTPSVVVPGVGSDRRTARGRVKDGEDGRREDRRTGDGCPRGRREVPPRREVPRREGQREEGSAGGVAIGVRGRPSPTPGSESSGEPTQRPGTSGSDVGGRDDTRGVCGTTAFRGRKGVHDGRRTVIL